MCKGTRLVENKEGNFDPCSSCMSNYEGPPYDDRLYEEPSYEQTSTNWYKPRHDTW